MYDLNKVVDSGVYPLDYRGSINPSGSYYHELSAENSDYFWNNTLLKMSTLLTWKVEIKILLVYNKINHRDARITFKLYRRFHGQ